MCYKRERILRTNGVQKRHRAKLLQVSNPYIAIPCVSENRSFCFASKTKLLAKQETQLACSYLCAAMMRSDDRLELLPIVHILNSH